MGSYENPAIITDKSGEILAQGLTNVGNIFSQYAATLATKKKAEAEEVKQFDRQVDAVKAWEYGTAGQLSEKLGTGYGAFIDQVKPFVAEDLANISKAKVQLLKAKSREEKDTILKQISDLEQIYKTNVAGIESILGDVQTSAENTDANYLNGIIGTSSQLYTGYGILNGSQPGKITLSRGEKGNWVVNAAPSGDGPSKDIPPVSIDSFWMSDPKNRTVSNKPTFINDVTNEIFKTTNLNENNFSDQHMRASRDILKEDGSVAQKTTGIENRKILDVSIYDKPTENLVKASMTASFGPGVSLLERQGIYNSIVGEGDPVSYEEFLQVNASLSEKERNDKLLEMGIETIKAKQQEELKKQYKYEERDGKIIFYTPTGYKADKVEDAKNKGKTYKPTVAEKQKAKAKSEIMNLKGDEQFNFAKGNFNKYVKKVGNEYKVYDKSGDLDVLTFKNETDALNFMYGL
jgi:hypothetical protein